MPFLLIGASPKTLTYAAPHNHSFYEIILNTEGEGVAVIGNEEYPFRAGSIHVIPPNTTHTKRSDEGFKDIYIRTDDPPAAPDNLRQITGCYEDDGERSLTNLMKMMLQRYIGRDGKNDPTLSLMYDLLTQLLTEKSSEPQADPIIEDVRRRLALSYNDPELSLSAVLESTGYNKDHIRRRFIAVCGVTPGEYLTALRIGNAKKLLKRRKEMRLTVADIGAMCGYYDEHYFSRVFRKQVGVTPKEFSDE